MNLRENISRIKKLMLVEESDLFFNEVLSIGDSGDNVEELQNLLGIYADGEFGPQTKKCVEIFQKKVNIEDDGIIGPETSEKLSKVEGGELEVELPDWCKVQGGKEPSEVNLKPKEKNTDNDVEKKSQNNDKKTTPKTKSGDGIILMGGLDTRPNDKNINQQVEMVKKSSNNNNVIGHRYSMLGNVLNSIKENPTYNVILFSAGCAHSRKIADAMSDKSKLYIVEPFAVSSPTKSSVRGAVDLGVPSQNVVVGPTEGRGRGVVDGATKTPSGIGHWGALEYVAGMLK